MSPGSMVWILGITVIFSFFSSLMIAALGGNGRLRRAAATLHSAAFATLNLLLLNGFLANGQTVRWGAFELNGLSFPFLFILNMVSVAAVLYASFNRSSRQGLRYVISTIPLAAGFGGLSVLSNNLVLFAVLWGCVTLTALLGLLAHGRDGFSERFKAFLPWLGSDILFFIAAALAVVWLEETALLIEPPLLSGNEYQVVVIAVLLIASACIRLGVFPFHFWTGKLVGRTDPGWSGFTVGGLNFLLVGFRLVLALALVSRLIVNDWGMAVVLVGALSVAAGPITAMESRSALGYVSGMYCLQAGFLLVGAGLYSRSGIDGALFCLLVSPLFLTGMIMAVGTTGELRGSQELGTFRFPVRAAPAALAVFLISGMSLAGMPPLDGFVGKLGVALSNMDKASFDPLFALIAALVLAAVAAASVAAIRATGGIFASGGTGATGRLSAVESLSALALCGGSIFIGIFPGVLMRNFVQGASFALFPGGFVGPGVVFRGTSVTVDAALAYYESWSSDVGTFLLLATAISLTLYFLSRTRFPVSGNRAGSSPFLGGAAGDYPAPQEQADSVLGSLIRSRRDRREG